ncbi:MAG: universal stress protein [Alphaproteobacteria bacterium]|nr:universal stress protein [Alphaproteobacteria bacterium]
MSYKTIVVHVDQSKNAVGRVAYAAQLARAQGAHLVGFHPVSPFQIPAYSEVAISAQIIDKIQAQAEADASQAKANFAQETERTGVAGEWRRLDGDPVELTALNARYADVVTVLAINPEGGADGHGEIPCADICLHLARHGVKATASYLHADDIDAGDLLLSRASDEGADMIVMGAYGHSRLRELVLGGVTRTVLDVMTVPILMAH